MKLTEFSRSAGCAGKLSPRDLEFAIQGLPAQCIPEIIVGYEDSDDAGVFLLTPDLALVQTIDFFSPVVDDPFSFGRIAATNALSDIYAMGGQPRTALSVVGFPPKGLDFGILREIMRGGLDKLNEAGVALLGGHSLRDDEVKFGYAVTGVVNKKDIKRNTGARAGSRILLTKPLGTGLITTALKRGKAAPEHVREATDVMTQLNRRAAEICVECGVDTMTDVTGFGLIGHAMEVARASRISIRIDHSRIPVIAGTAEYSAAGFCAGGLESNREFYSQHVRYEASVPPGMQNILFDPQTSGGLLIFAKTSVVDDLVAKFLTSGLRATEIGVTAQPAAVPIVVF